MKISALKNSLLLLVTANSLYSQTLKVNYYDWQKTKKSEEYYVNANGEKQGKYKKYDEQGQLTDDAVYLNNQLEGTYFNYTYSFCPSNQCPKSISQKENYKNGTLEGPAEYYAYNQDIGVYVKTKGEYLDGKKTGTWFYIKPFGSADYKNDPDFNGSHHVKEIYTYKNDEKILDGSIKVFYYPSGKLYTEDYYLGGVKTGTSKFYYPTGAIWEETIYSNGKIISQRDYYKSGKLKSVTYKDGVFTYEGYNEDGTPDAQTEQFQKAAAAKEQRKQQRINSSINVLNRDVGKADSLFMQNMLPEAQKLYSSAISTIDYDRLSEEESKAVKESKEYISAKAKLQAVENKISERDLLTKQSIIINDSINAAYNSLKTNPLIAKNKNVTQKTNLLLQSEYDAFQKELHIDKKVSRGRKILILVMFLNSSTDNDLSELNDKLKKAKNLTDISTILKY